MPAYLFYEQLGNGLMLHLEPLEGSRLDGVPQGRGGFYGIKTWDFVVVSNIFVIFTRLFVEDSHFD